VSRPPFKAIQDEPGQFGWGLGIDAEVTKHTDALALLPVTYAASAGGFNFAGPFTSLLDIATGEGFIMKPTTDTHQGVIGWQHASPAGYLFHLEARAGSAAPAAMIGIGLDVKAPDGGLGASGILISNKVGAQGIVLSNGVGNDNPNGYGLYGANDSAIAPLVSLHQRVAGAAPAFEVISDAANAGQTLARFLTPGNHLAGDINASTGTLRWIDPARMNALTLSNPTGTGAPAGLTVTDPSAVTAIGEFGVQAGIVDVGVNLFRPTGDGRFWGFRMTTDANLVKFQTSDTAAKGAESFSTVMTMKMGAIGFFGVTPVAKPTGVAVTAAAIHAALVSLGLVAA